MFSVFPATKSSNNLRWFQFSTLNHVLHMDPLGRDRDRAVERSPAFELFHQLPGVLVIDTLHAKLETHRIKQRDIRTRWLGTIHHSLNSDLNSLQGNSLR